MAKKDTYLALLRRGIDDTTAQQLADSGLKIGDLKKIDKDMLIENYGLKADIADGVIINTKASVDHDNYLMRFSSLAPGVCTGGNVSIGQRSAISIGATIKHGIKIGHDVVVGANSLVINDIISNQVAYGTPAKLIRQRSRGDKYL